MCSCLHNFIKYIYIVPDTYEKVEFKTETIKWYPLFLILETSEIYGW